MNNDVLLERFRVHLLSAGRSLNTIRVRLVYLRMLQAEQDDLLTMQRADLELFLALRRETHKAETRALIRTTLRQFYGWAVEERLITDSPAEHLASVRVPTAVPRVALDGDVQNALARAGDRDTAIILLARYGMLRRSEIAALHMRHRRGPVLYVLGKGEKERRVPINTDLMSALRRLEDAQPHGFYFPGGHHGHIDGETVHHAITKLVGINPHALRHAGASSAYRRTRNLMAVQELLGHASVSTTQRYVHTSEAELVAAADATTLMPSPAVDTVGPAA